MNFYSFGTRIDLDETCLDETVGVGEDPIDWNRDGVFDTCVVADINHPAGSPGDGRFDPLLDYDDYSNLYLAVAGALAIPDLSRTILSMIPFQRCPSP